MHYFYNDTVAQDTRKNFLMSVKPTIQISNDVTFFFFTSIQVHVIVNIGWNFCDFQGKIIYDNGIIHCMIIILSSDTR